MFVKPHDVPPLLCFNVQIEMRFGVEQLLFTMFTLCKQELFYSKSHFSVKLFQWLFFELVHALQIISILPTFQLAGLTKECQWCT